MTKSDTGETWSQMHPEAKLLFNCDPVKSKLCVFKTKWQDGLGYSLPWWKGEMGKKEGMLTAMSKTQQSKSCEILHLQSNFFELILHPLHLLSRDVTCTLWWPMLWLLKCQSLSRSSDSSCFQQASLTGCLEFLTGCVGLNSHGVARVLCPRLPSLWGLYRKSRGI